jgi:predicted XRE-type DNA-binding protein
MLNRCRNPNNPGYSDYGGRGITVCERWQSYEAFYSDMGVRPSSKHSIERKKNHLGYEPTNCEWAVRDTQANNKRSNVILEFRGRSQSLQQWVTELDLDYQMTAYRIRRGMSAEKALSLPREFKARPKLDDSVVDQIVAMALKGETQKWISERLGVPQPTVSDVFRRKGLRTTAAIAPLKDSHAKGFLEIDVLGAFIAKLSEHVPGAEVMEDRTGRACAKSRKRADLFLRRDGEIMPVEAKRSAKPQAVRQILHYIELEKAQVGFLVAHRFSVQTRRDAEASAGRVRLIAVPIELIVACKAARVKGMAA